MSGSATPPVPLVYAAMSDVSALRQPSETAEEAWLRIKTTSDKFLIFKDALKMLVDAGVDVRFPPTPDFALINNLSLDNFPRPADLLVNYAIPRSKFTYRYDEKGVLSFTWEEGPPNDAREAMNLQGGILFEISQLAKRFSTAGIFTAKRDSDYEDLAFSCYGPTTDTPPTVHVVKLEASLERGSKVSRVINTLVNTAEIRTACSHRPLHDVQIRWRMLRRDDESPGCLHFVFIVRDKTVEKEGDKGVTTSGSVARGTSVDIDLCVDRVDEMLTFPGVGSKRTPAPFALSAPPAQKPAAVTKTSLFQ